VNALVLPNALSANDEKQSFVQLNVSWTESAGRMLTVSAKVFVDFSSTVGLLLSSIILCWHGLRQAHFKFQSVPLSIQSVPL